MKAAVVYYSATGNTAKLAKAICRGAQTEIDCDLISIKNANPKDMAAYDLIYIGGPIWYYRETANLRLFAYEMSDMMGKYFAPFCAHGSAPEGFLYSISSMMKKKGMTLIGWNDWYASVHQVLHMPKPYMTDGHPDEIALEQAEAFGKEIAGKAKRIAAGEAGLIPKQLSKKDDPLWGLVGEMPRPDGEGMPPMPEGEGPPKGMPMMERNPPERKVDKSKCKYPDCTLCVDNCIVNAIDFSKDPVEFKKQCVNCALCDKLCPEAAIEVDADTMMSRTRHVIDMDKCKYPACTLCVDHCPMNSIDFSVTPPVFKKNCEGDDLCWVICPEGAIEITNLETTHMMLDGAHDESHMFMRKLAQAEAAGKFRRHVPVDKIGWDNILYKNPNAPRFIIEEE